MNSYMSGVKLCDIGDKDFFHLSSEWGNIESVVRSI
jgi:hypothetical protein